MHRSNLVLIVLQVTYNTAIAAVFIEGWIFIALSITGVRAKIIALIPK